MDDFAVIARNATQTGFRVEPQDGGVHFSWGDDPLDFIWQTEEQATDLIDKLLQLVKY